MRITVVGVNYAPEPTGIAPYTAGTARGLAALGHRVTVHTGFPHYPQWEVAPEYRGRGRVVEDDGPVTVVRHPLAVEPGTGTRGRIRMEAGFAARVLGARWERPDVVLVVSPSLLSAAATVARARAARIPVGVLVQDLYGLGVVETGAMAGPVAGLVAGLERRTLLRATSVAVIHDKFAEQVTGMGVPPERVRVIRNWTHVDVAAFAGIGEGDRLARRRELGWPDDETVVLHAGNMGAKQGLDNVVEAGRRSDGRRLRFVLLGDGNQRESLERAALGVDAVQFVRPLPDPEFVATVAAADVLLVNELPEVGDMAVPSKLTTYAAAARPVLAATRSDSASAHEIRTGGFGVVIPPADPSALRDAALAITADADGGRRMGAAGVRYATEVLDESTAISAYEHWCTDLAAIGRGRG
ncbi:glycosyltransferase family 4 protein [Tsukamurella serpentis]